MGRIKTGPDFINNLPPELLIQIFHKALDNLHPELQYSAALRQLRLVCSRWASIIDNAGTLWATTSCRDPEQAVAMALQKCQGSLLRVSCRCDLYRTRYCSYVDQILPYSHLWHSLHVKACNVTTITVLLHEPAPNLREISVNFAPGSRNANTVPTVPSTTIANVEKFAVSSCTIIWGGINTANLRNLVLNDVRDVNVGNILETLAAAKSLTELAMSRCWIDPVYGDIEAGAVVLPNLKQFVMEYIHYDAAAQLISAIEHPKTTRLQVFTTFEIGTCQPIIRRFAKQFAHAASEDPTIWFCVRIGQKSVQFRSGGHYLHFLGPATWERDGAVTNDHPVDKWGALSLTMETHFGPALRSYSPKLVIEGPPDDAGFYGQSQVIAMCALGLPQTKYLHLISSDSGLEGMVYALSLRFDGGVSRSRELTGSFRAFPELTTLRLDERREDAPSLDQRKILMYEQLNGELNHLVRQRRSDPNSKPIRNLIVKEHVMSPAYLREVSRIVQAFAL